MAGDALLKAVALLCARSLREDDVFARFGGEEFVVVARTPLGRGLQLADRCVWPWNPSISRPRRRAGDRQFWGGQFQDGHLDELLGRPIRPCMRPSRAAGTAWSLRPSWLRSLREPAGLRLLADIVLAAHMLLALFLPLPYRHLVGGPRWRLFGRGFGGWRWVHNRAFAWRTLSAWPCRGRGAFGVTCPLTDLESLLRVQAGGQPYPQSFIGHWLSGCSSMTSTSAHLRPRIWRAGADGLAWRRWR